VGAEATSSGNRPTREVDARGADVGCPVDHIDFFDPEVNDCPYPSYRTMRDEAPVWLDERLGLYHLTRHEDVLMVLKDTERFPSGRKGPRGPGDRAAKIKALYETKGWVPAPTLAGRDDPNHKEMRKLFNHAFRPKRIRELEPTLESLAHQLIDDFIDDGRCDWVQAFAVPLPLLMIGMQMGADPADIWKIKAWTDAWVQRLGMMQTEEEALWSTEMEIEAQHYFQPIFDRLREHPEDSLISDLVNTVIPEWGRTLTNEELHAEMMADTFVGGSETSTNAISGGIWLLGNNRDQWELLRSDPEQYLPVLVEEVLRLESPVQRLFRTTAVDVELHGVTIPAGAMIVINYASANRDERVFDRPAEFDLTRADAKQHLGFGFGIHHCLGAPLARRELMHSFQAFVDRIDDFALAGDQEYSIAPNYSLRALNKLDIEFTSRPK
jgi:cytochrome P450